MAIVGVFFIVVVFVIAIVCSINNLSAQNQKEQSRHLENVEKLYIYIYNKTTMPRFHQIVRNYETKYLALKGETRKAINKDYDQNTLKIGEGEEVKL